nr:MAG: hypothetical protein Ga0209084_100071414 [Lavidaviridae sp.]
MASKPVPVRAANEARLISIGGGGGGGGGGHIGYSNASAFSVPTKAVEPSMPVTGSEVFSLGRSAHRRAMSLRTMDYRAQTKFWLEVMPLLLTKQLFDTLFANFDNRTGRCFTKFNIRSAIDDSAPEKTPDVCDIKPAFIDPDDSNYDVDLYWIPMCLTKEDFVWGPPNCDWHAPSATGVYADSKPVVTDFFRFQFPMGIQERLVEEVCPAVRDRAIELFREHGFDLIFPKPMQPGWVHMICLKSLKTGPEWTEYWKDPAAGFETFSVELKASTSGDPSPGQPGYEEALKRPAIKLDKTIAETELEANRAAREKREKNKEAEALMARMAERVQSPVPASPRKKLTPLRVTFPNPEDELALEGK